MSDSAGHRSNPSSGSGRPAASSPAAGERRVITVLFCDVVGSTSLAARLDPEEWAEVMNEAFRYMIAPVEEYGGMVARLMGDAVLAFFGAPLAHEDDPQRAVLAGLGIVNGMRPFIHQFEQDYGLDFNVRVGINTGPVVVGEMGPGQVGEYTAMGDAINLAARMEQTAAPGTVQISEETYRLIAPLFDVWDLGKIEVKGRDEPVQAYRVLGLEPQPGRLRGLEGIRSPLIGREREFGRLRALLDDLQDGRSHICYLVGEAGLGKTRLIAELRQVWRDRMAAVYGDVSPLWQGWSEFVAVSYGASKPYDMLKRQVRGFCGIRESDPPAVIHERLESLIAAYPPALHERMHRVFGFLLGDTTVDLGEPAQGEAFQRELRAVLEQMAQVQASRGPVVYVIDDVHWADVASLEAIRNLLPMVGRRPVLFLFAMRPDWSAPGWQLYLESQLEYPEYSASIYLEPLTAADSRTLVRGLLGDADVPERIYDLIERKAEGNPFFVEETVRALLDIGSLSRDGDGFRWDAAADVERVADLISLPENVLALLTARIDKLDGPVRRTLQLASVIGRAFPLRVLERMADRPAEALEEHLKRLAQADLVRPSLSGAEAEYAFRHALTRDAAYETILLRQRRRYHRRVAEAFEALYAGRTADEAPRLAYHFQEARDWAKAIHYYALAGESAAQLYANAEAIEHYEQALAIARDNPTAIDDAGLVDLYRRFGRVYEVANRYDDALALYESLVRLGRERDDATLQLEGLMPQAVIHVTPTSHMDAGRGRELVARVLALGEATDRYDALARAHWCLMLLHTNAAPEPDKAIEHGERALALARRHELSDIEAFVLNDIGRAYGAVGRIDDTFAAFAQAREMWRRAGNDLMVADSLGVTATAYVLTGDPARALEHAREGLEISRRSNNEWGMAFNAYVMGYALMELGELSEAIGLLEASAGRAGRADFPGIRANAALMLAWLYGELGRFDLGREAREELFARSQQDGPMPEMAALWALMNARYSGDAAAAVELARAMELPLSYGGGQEAVFISLMAATALVEGGEHAAALEWAAHALAGTERLRFRAYRADLLTVRGAALAGLGRMDEALAAWRAAAAEARAQGARRAEWAPPAALAAHEPDRDAAEECRRRASETIDYLAGKLDEAELRDGFLSRPEVRANLSPGANT